VVFTVNRENMVRVNNGYQNESELSSPGFEQYHATAIHTLALFQRNAKEENLDVIRATKKFQRTVG
jgi:hypothetical protein